MIKVKQIVKKAHEEGKELEYDKLLAFCMIEFGIARRTAKDYVDPLLIIGDLKVKDSPFENE